MFNLREDARGRRDGQSDYIGDIHIERSMGSVHIERSMGSDDEADQTGIFVSTNPMKIVYIEVGHIVIKSRSSEWLYIFFFQLSIH